MPSPFPGMDPYLENPAFFSDLHDSMITYVREYLKPRLPKPYYAVSNERVWVEISRRSRQNFIEIRTADDRERLVTTIEILSPTNKTPGEDARDLYLQKQREVLRSRTNLVEIDLLRGGVHSTAVPLDSAIAEVGSFDYHVCIYRSDDLEHFQLYAIRLEDRLPEIAVPLLPGDATVLLDLQMIFDRAYDFGPYDQRTRYDEPNSIKPPLRPEQQEWANRILRDKGLIPSA